MSNKAAILSEYEDILEASNKKLQIEETLFSEMLSTADSIFRNQSVSPFIKFNYINDDLKIIVLKTLQQYANDIPNLGSIYAYAVYSVLLPSLVLTLRKLILLMTCLRMSPPVILQQRLIMSTHWLFTLSKTVLDTG